MKEHQPSSNHQHHPHQAQQHHHHNPRGSSLPLFALIGVWVCFFEVTKVIWIYSRLDGQHKVSPLRRFPALEAFLDDDDNDKREPVPVAVAIESPGILQDDSQQKDTASNPQDVWEKKKEALIKGARNVVLAKPNTKQDVCRDQMRLIYQRQNCLQQASRGDLTECLRLLREEEEESRTKPFIKETNDHGDTHTAVVVPGPVHQLSYMWGQGFGRIITQGVRTCNLAALLHRPCSIDLYRDKLFNFRAFLKPGSLDWDAASRVVMAQNSVNISDALHKMPKGIQKGHGWEELLQDGKDDVPKYDNVLPMVWGRDRTVTEKTIQQHLDYWDGQNSDHGHQVLLSPNFGDAWYAYGHDYIRLRDQWNKRKRPCSHNHLKTLLQNEMFVPTSLAYELHLERRALVLQEAQLQLPMDKSVLTTSSGLSARDTLPPYGAIHLRMKILNQDMYKLGVSKEQVLGGLKECLDSFSQFRALRWWLISDDADVAEFISQNLDNVYSYDESLKVPAEAEADTKATLRPQGIHSGDAIGQKFGQEALAPSMIDWMGLHESQIALVTWDTAYGETGARGNGKIQEGTCGGMITGGKNGKLSLPMFNVYK